MKKIVLALTLAAALSADAVTPVNHGRYILVPAGPVATGLFLTEDAGGNAVTSDDYSPSAAWQWDWVSGTASTPGHYTLKNVSSGRYLYSVGADGCATLSDSEVGIKRQAATVVTDASVFTDGQTYLSTSASGRVEAQSEPTAWSEFLLISYSADASAEEMIEAAKEQRRMIDAKANAIAELEPLFRASQSGTNGLTILYSNIGSCTTLAELEQSVIDMRRVGIRMFESDMEVGAVWRQLSTGLWVTFSDGEYRGLTTPGVAGIWYAEFTDNGNTILDNRQFYLRSNASRRYIVAPETDNAPVGTAVNKQGATLWKVVSTPGGIAITPDLEASVNDAPRLLYLNAEGILAVNRPASESDAVCYAGSLPTFGEGINSIVPIGTETSINALEITVSSGAKAVADGEISLSLRRADTAGTMRSTLLCTYSPSELTAPVAKTIEIDYYNSQGQHITGQAQVDIYTLPLDSAYTAGGEYMARMSFASFELNGAYSEECGGFTVLDENDLWLLIVEPADGLTLPLLDKITINGPNGVYPNPNAAEMTTLSIKFDPTDAGATEEILSASEADFEQGGKYDSYDFNADEPDWFTIPCNFDTAGRYTLTIPRGFFIDNNNAESAELVYSWTVDPDAGIVTPEVRTQQGEIFDLMGHRLHSAPTGSPYILNHRLHLNR